ncbi:MAG: class I SAM-dependent methyltransferase [Nitrospirae bacterium]|nr:class I SAM-dependent methyltransferase [Nitrospirota bacterium]MBF0533425.1 class I SAM-dependent methyltransferase [Nitrospirota bacterium]MBF0616049.1 class I SAM-dependent methyltransferase [Nitrospirota bacterium]
MPHTKPLFPTKCAICNTEGNSTELYRANFEPESFNATKFSARRVPDKTHYRIVKCNSCGLVRSDPVVSADVAAGLYHQSSFKYEDEVENLKITYGRYLKKLTKYGQKKESIFEIGCGNGFFLEYAKSFGFTHVCGIEPSKDAISKASDYMKQHIICDMLNPGKFEPETFDVICFFQLIDHIYDVGLLLKECYRLLKPGGLILCINHNVSALSSRLLGEHSPIFDIEHTYLFDEKTLSKVFLANNFTVKEVATSLNRISLSYLNHLLPLPSHFKVAVSSFLKYTKVAATSFFLPLGNIYIIAEKPGESL